VIRDLFELRPSPPRLTLAARTALAAAIPILIGVAAGDVGAGLVATLGTFTARFSGDRPYLNRGMQLAVISVALAAGVTVGAWAAPILWLAIVAVTVVAVVAVWICGALSVGPPGAYVFVLVCAAGVGVSASHLAPWRIGLLVLAGGAVAWMVQMAPALTGFRRPEETAVAAAGEAVAAYLDAPSDVTRAQAAAALHRAWAILVTYQPRSARLPLLRDTNHALHILFTDGMRGTAPPDAAATARALGALQIAPSPVVLRDVVRVPLRPPSAATLLAEALRPGSQTRWVMRRVAVAVPLAGVAAGLLGLGHIYWAMAAAVLVLHLGTHRAATLLRGAQRLLGTWLGLLLAAVMLAVHPQGLWLALIVPALQFLVELLVVRNYLLATIFITATALTISSGAHEVDAWALLVDRGVDTLIGCTIGVAVYLLTASRQEAHRLAAAIATTLDRTADATGHLSAAWSLSGRRARRDLQVSIIALGTAYDDGLSGSRQQRATAARLGAAVAATERLGYLTVAACWAAEHGRDDALRDTDNARYLAVLHELAEAVRGLGPPPEVAGVPAEVTADINVVATSLSPP
jgi:uncharacterized membrane protein YccC